MKTTWPPADGDEQAMRVTDFYAAAHTHRENEEGDMNELASWFGKPVAVGEIF